jgi:hypothetical protein
VTYTKPKPRSRFRRLDYAAKIFLAVTIVCLGFAIFCPLDVLPMSWIKDFFAKF